MPMQFLFDGVEGTLRTIIVGVLAYVALVAILRTSGKRTLSKMNAFDLIVTVALGSTLATILLSRDVPLSDGLVAFLVLVGMQYLITKTSLLSSTVAHLVKSEPRALLYRGHVLHDALRDARVLESELQAALRQSGHASYADVDLVVLETDGSFSVLAAVADPSAPAVDSLQLPHPPGASGPARG